MRSSVVVRCAAAQSEQVALAWSRNDHHARMRGHPHHRLPQDKFFKSGDLIWLLPPVVHMALVVMRPHAIDFFKDAGLKLDGMPQYNVLWGFIIQVMWLQPDMRSPPRKAASVRPCHVTGPEVQ